MKRYQKEIIKLTSKEVLLSIFDLATPFFETHSIYRVSAKKYKEEREIEKSIFADKISYLKRHGLIETFVEGKEKYFEVTPYGLQKIQKHRSEETIPRPLKWDSKWRIVIFDIPNTKNTNRDMFRRKLINLGFEQIQESVYVYPFECTNQIAILSNQLSITDNVLIMVSDIIQGEGQIIEHFLNKGTINKTDLE